MATTPSDTVNVINKKLTKGVLKLNVDVICSNVTESRGFFYITNLVQLCKYIPDLKPDDVLLIIMVTESFDPEHFFDDDCKFFIKDFNSLPFNDFSFVHSIDTCPTDNTHGVGFTLLKEYRFVPRKGTKPKKATTQKKHYKFKKGKKNTFNMTVSSMWIRLPNGKDYNLVDTQFVLKLVESPSWIVDNTPILKPIEIPPEPTLTHHKL